MAGQLHKQLFDHSLFEAGRGFSISLRASNRYSPTYLKPLAASVRLLAEFGQENHWPPLPELTTFHLEEYFLSLQERPRWFGQQGNGTRGLSQGYIAAEFRRLHRFFRWAEERGHIETNPLRLIVRPFVDEKVVETVSQDAMLLLLALKDPSRASRPKHRFRLLRDRLALLLLWDTPGRLSEISTLTLDQVDLDRGLVLVLGKGRRERWMPLGNKTREALWEYLRARDEMNADSDSLWISSNGQGLDGGWMASMLKRLRGRANLPGLHTHQFRHTFAMAALRSGMPEEVLRMLAGWRKNVPETYYRTLDAEDAQRFHARMSPADNLGGEGKARTRSSNHRWS